MKRVSLCVKCPQHLKGNIDVGSSRDKIISVKSNILIFKFLIVFKTGFLNW